MAVPAAVAGPAEPGDVVVFRAERLHGGGLTTHRIVAETDAGYVTKGDANPFTDQDGGEPPVTDGQIVAHALRSGGSVVAVPHLGTAAAAIRETLYALQSGLAAMLGTRAVLGTRGMGLLLFGAGALLLVGTLATEARGGRRRGRTRSPRRTGVVDTRAVAVVLVAAVVVPATAAMLVPGGVHETTLDGDAVAASDAVGDGGTVSWEYELRNRGYVPLAFVLEPTAEGTTVDREVVVVPPGGERSVTVAVDAPPPGQRRVAGVVEHRYLLVLPRSSLLSLHEVHPLAAVAAVDAVLGGAVLAVLARFVGLGLVRVRDETSIGARVRQWLW
ncbi:S26 family signal peptidase [Halomicrobium urmianum]|uniref:S26 family signal peptidase n=1 Tax=Halomicrobium urmianum TaxID=1586233 RepID=UPI001CD99C92|nr:S26 family signal peptidase [Halomicrobium urmianum]